MAPPQAARLRILRWTAAHVTDLAEPDRWGDDRMADDHPSGVPVVPVLDLPFDSGTLGALRAGVKLHACKAGLPEDRAEDVVLVVHELAANAVCHGAGAGRLRIWKLAGTLRCQVEDGDPADGPASGRPLPSRPGHGLWLVRQVADRMRILSGARGTRATVAFDLPAGRKGQGCLQA
jgi:anti-sigma regulatory factor (Ser/Thr protein kinase)